MTAPRLDEYVAKSWDLYGQMLAYSYFQRHRHLFVDRGLQGELEQERQRLVHDMKSPLLVKTGSSVRVAKPPETFVFQRRTQIFLSARTHDLAMKT
jgi:hypothetical protein